MTNELEEMRISLEQSDRFRKALETDIQDASERLLEISSHNSNLNVQKRKLETDYSSLQSDLDEKLAELKNTEERCKKTTLDAMKLSEELKIEQVNHKNYYKNFF